MAVVDSLEESLEHLLIAGATRTLPGLGLQGWTGINDTRQNHLRRVTLISRSNDKPEKQVVQNHMI